MAGFALTSPSFVKDDAIPARHSCDGEDISPALAWQGAPAQTASFALVVDDPDARGFVHWVVFDIPGGTAGYLPEGLRASDNPPQGRNDFGTYGWGGPCPPRGRHEYRFTLYSLSRSIGLTGRPTAADVRRAVSRLLLAETTLTATYTRR
jgi:Raf kinase inhibitor-like YbhB/YbcL family protein